MTVYCSEVDTGCHFIKKFHLAFQVTLILVRNMSYVLGNPHCSFPKMMCLMFTKVEELAEHWVFNMRCMQIGRISGDEQKA